MITPFRELGCNIGETWGRIGSREGDFTALAVDQLQESGLLGKLSHDEVARWLMNTSEAPRQDTWEFGQPAIKVYEQGNFYIQVLFWIDGTTSVHEHSFAGAFGVLSGSSIHTTYSFERQQSSCPALVTGKLTYVLSEVLQKGDVRPIHLGASIHALFHLDRPTVSVVIRTQGSASCERQYNFLRPGIAIDPSYAPGLHVIQLRMLESLAKIGSSDFWERATELLMHTNLWVAYKVMAMASSRRTDSSQWSSLLRVAAEIHGESAIDQILKCLVNLDAERRILKLRESIHDPVHRYFLALLLNVPTRKEIYSLIGKRMPWGDPESLVIRWLGEIFRESRVGLRFTPITLLMLQVILKGGSFSQVLPTIHSRLGRDHSGLEEIRLRRMWDQLHNIDILRPLLFTDRFAEDLPTWSAAVRM